MVLCALPRRVTLLSSILNPPQDGKADCVPFPALSDMYDNANTLLSHTVSTVVSGQVDTTL